MLEDHRIGPGGPLSHPVDDCKLLILLASRTDAELTFPSIPSCARIVFIQNAIRGRLCPDVSHHSPKAHALRGDLRGEPDS